MLGAFHSTMSVNSGINALWAYLEGESLIFLAPWQVSPLSNASSSRLWLYISLINGVTQLQLDVRVLQVWCSYLALSFLPQTCTYFPHWVPTWRYCCHSTFVMDDEMIVVNCVCVTHPCHVYLNWMSLYSVDAHLWMSYVTHQLNAPILGYVTACCGIPAPYYRPTSHEYEKDIPG